MLIYLDNSATTRQLDFVRERVSETADKYFGNPSSLHRLGMEAEKVLKEAARSAARSLGASEGEVYFTSGGTESNNTVLFGAASGMKRKGNHIITSAVEHPAVLECCRRLETQGFRVTYAGVDGFGRVDVGEIADAVTSETILVSVMSVNNELGTIEPLAEIGKLKRQGGSSSSKGDPGFLFHTDHVQGYGKIDLKPSELGIDFLSASAHKLHGPRGVGLLYARKGARIDPLIYGGGQERGFRSGTEDLPGIAGFEAALSHSFKNIKENNEHMAALKSRLLENIKAGIPDIRVNSPSGDGSVPGILNVSFMGIRGEVLLHMLEQDDIYISTGSACSSHKKGGSHVLKAAGLNADEIEGAIRFSFSELNTVEEIDIASEKLEAAVRNIRKTLRYKPRSK